MTSVNQENRSKASRVPVDLGLQLNNISKSFGASIALNGVNLEVKKGEIHGLVGENGAGKSTLMAVASGALEPDEGETYIDGHRAGNDPEEARSLGLAIVRQHPALLPELTVLDNLRFGIRESQRKKIDDPLAWARECLSLWSDRPDIEPRARAGTLNPEQQFVVEITRALYQKPKVLVLDEPSEHLGAEGVEHLFSIMRRLAEEGTAIVYISHRIREIQEVAERITILRDGIVTGTNKTALLDSQEIVSLIIGRSLDDAYPEKPAAGRFLDAKPLIEVKDFKGESFNDINFDIKPGEILGFAGIDGNGQAEIARALAGLQQAKGRIRLDGRKVRIDSPREAARAGISYLPADRKKEGLFPGLSVRSNTSIRATGRMSSGPLFSKNQEIEYTDNILGEFAVKSSSPASPIESLSGGNQQKVVMAAALLNDPKLLIADQPTQGVDVGSKTDIYRHLREVAEKGSSILVLSSDNAELAGLCDRVLVVSRGQIVAVVEGQDLREGDITDAVLKAESRREHVRGRPSKWTRVVDSDWAPIPVLSALILAFALIAQLINPHYLSSQNIGTVLSVAAVMCLVSLGQGLVLMRRGIDLSVGPLMSVVLVIASYYIVDEVDAGYHIIGWFIILLVCFIVGTSNWFLVDRLKVHPVLATFAMWLLLESWALMMRSTPGGLIAGATSSFINQRFLFIIPLTFLIAIVTAIALDMWRSRSKAGRELLASGNDASTASSLGISESRTSFIAYVGCSLLAGLAAILLIPRIGVGDPSAGEVYTLQSVAVAVVAGVSLFGARGSFIAIVFSAVLLTQARTSTTFLGLNDAWQNIFLALLTIGAVFFYSIARRVAKNAGGAS